MDNPLLWPLLVQVWLTIVVIILTFSVRVKSYKQGKVNVVYFKHNQGKAPKTMLRWGDNLQNQFELPVLFYALVTILIATENTESIYIILAWIFVFSRVVHSWIHIKSNHIGQRLTSFAAGFITIIVMWITFTIQMLTH